MTTQIRNNLGWGAEDSPYHHTHPTFSDRAAATPQSLEPQQQLQRLRHLLTVEGQERGISLSALSRFFSNTIAAYQNDAGSDARFSRVQNESQRNLSEIQQLIRTLAGKPQYALQLAPLLAEFDRIQGFLELEETLRSGTSILGTDNFQRMGVFINMGASLAGRFGNVAAMAFGLRGNVGLALASGLANAWFQNAIHLTHAYGEGRNFTNREIGGELGDSSVAAMACSLLSVGLGAIRGKSAWWTLGVFTADVMCEFVLSEVSPLKRLLGLEVRGLRHGLEAYAYGIAANALGEILGDGAGTLVQRAGRSSRSVVEVQQQDIDITGIAPLFQDFQAPFALPVLAASLGLAALHSNELFQMGQDTFHAALEVLKTLKMPLMMAASTGLMSVTHFERRREIGEVTKELQKLSDPCSRKRFAKFYTKLRAVSNTDGKHSIEKYTLLVKAGQRLKSEDYDLVFQRLLWMLNAAQPIAAETYQKDAALEFLKDSKVNEAHALLILNILPLLLVRASLNPAQIEILAELLPKLRNSIQKPHPRIAELALQMLDTESVKTYLQQNPSTKNPLLHFFVNLMPVLAEGQRVKWIRSLFALNVNNVAVQELLFDSVLKLQCTVEEKILLLEFVLPNYIGINFQLAARTFDQLKKLLRHYQDKGDYTKLSQKFLTVLAILGSHKSFTEEALQNEWMKFVLHNVLPTQKQEALRLINLSIEASNFHLPKTANLLKTLADHGIEHDVLQNLARKIYQQIRSYNEAEGEDFAHHVFEIFPSWGRTGFAFGVFASVLLATHAAGAYSFSSFQQQHLGLLASVSHLQNGALFLFLAMAASSKLRFYERIALGLKHLFENAETKLKRRKREKALLVFKKLKLCSDNSDSSKNLDALGQIIRDFEGDYSEISPDCLQEIHDFVLQQVQRYPLLGQAIKKDTLNSLEKFFKNQNPSAKDKIDFYGSLLRHAPPLHLGALFKQMEIAGSENTEAALQVLEILKTYLGDIASQKIANLNLMALAKALTAYTQIQDLLHSQDDYDVKRNPQIEADLLAIAASLNLSTLKGRLHFEDLKPLLEFTKKLDNNTQQILFKRVEELLNLSFSFKESLKCFEYVLNFFPGARIIKLSLLESLLKGPHARDIAPSLNHYFGRIIQFDSENKPSLPEVEAWYDLLNFALENKLADKIALDIFKKNIHPLLLKALGKSVSDSLSDKLIIFNHLVEIREQQISGRSTTYESNCFMPLGLGLASMSGHTPSWSTFALAAVVATAFAIAEHKKPKKKKVAIVGGGMAGLFAAYQIVNRASENVEVEVLESSEHHFGGKAAPDNEGAQFIDDYEGNPLLEFIHSHPELGIKLLDAGDYDKAPFQLADGSSLSAEKFYAALQAARNHASQSLQEIDFKLLDKTTSYEWIENIPHLSDAQKEAMRGRLRIEEGSSNISALSLCINLARSKNLRRRFEVRGGIQSLVEGLQTYLKDQGVKFSDNTRVRKVKKEGDQVRVLAAHQADRICDAVIIALSPEHLQADHLGRPVLKVEGSEAPWQRLMHLIPATVHKANLSGVGIKAKSDSASAHWAHWSSTTLGSFNRMFSSVFHGLSGDKALSKQALREMVFAGLKGRRRKKDAEGHKIKVKDRAWDGKIGSDGVRHAYTTLPHPGRALGIVKLALQMMHGVYNTGRIFFASHVMGLGCYMHSAAEAGINMADQALKSMGLLAAETPMPVAASTLLAVSEEHYQKLLKQNLLSDDTQARPPLLDRFQKIAPDTLLNEWVAEGRKFYCIDLRSKNEIEEEGYVSFPHSLSFRLELKAEEKELSSDATEWDVTEWLARFEALHLNPDVPVVFLCSAGQRSFQVMRQAIKLHEQAHPARYAGEYLSVAGGVNALLMQIKNVITDKALQQKVYLKAGPAFFSHKGQNLQFLSPLYTLQQRLFRGEIISDEEKQRVYEALVAGYFALR